MKDQSGHWSPEACEQGGIRSDGEVGEPRATPVGRRVQQ